MLWDAYSLKHHHFHSERHAKAYIMPPRQVNDEEQRLLELMRVPDRQRENPLKGQSDLVGLYPISPWIIISLGSLGDFY